MITVDIDENSGFCFGVTSAINKAEEELANGDPLYSLGDIVHNSAEVRRLSEKGLIAVCHRDIPKLDGSRLLLRAHGEPPATYKTALKHNITIVDATCPVVLKLQQRIKKDYEDSLSQGRNIQIVIYGKPGHAEVNGLVGQTDGHAIVIEGPDQIERINFSVDISLYSQTTMSPEGFEALITTIRSKLTTGVTFRFFDTICRNVSNRVSLLKKFAASHDVVLFVTDEKSSNGKVLLSRCLSTNPNTYKISRPEDIDFAWFSNTASIGICGATSTPRWLMEMCRQTIIEKINNRI